jgi:ABC-type nitrate/sulfonate/bicarbonate transport system ATPase subunit
MKNILKRSFFIAHSIDEAWRLSSSIVGMTARPGRSHQEIVNDLPHPHNADVQLSSWYMELKGSRKNNFTFSAPIHPTQRHCENTEYGGYSLIFAPC